MDVIRWTGGRWTGLPYYMPESVLVHTKKCVGRGQTYNGHSDSMIELAQWADSMKITNNIHMCISSRLGL